MVERNCDNCLHLDVAYHFPPCCTCQLVDDAGVTTYSNFVMDPAIQASMEATGVRLVSDEHYRVISWPGGEARFVFGDEAKAREMALRVVQAPGTKVVEIVRLFAVVEASELNLAAFDDGKPALVG